MGFYFFPYGQYEYSPPGKPQSIELRPTLEFTVTHDGKSWSEDALVDTGSPLTLMTYNVAEALELEIPRPGAEIRQVQILGGNRSIQLETVELSINQVGADLTWTAEVGFFTEDWRMELQVGAIFGTRGFLDTWAVTFVAKKSYFVVEELESFDKRLPPNVDDIIASQHDDDWWRPSAH